MTKIMTSDKLKEAMKDPRFFPCCINFLQFYSYSIFKKEKEEVMSVRYERSVTFHRKLTENLFPPSSLPLPCWVFL